MRERTFPEGYSFCGVLVVMGMGSQLNWYELREVNLGRILAVHPLGGCCPCPCDSLPRDSVGGTGLHEAHRQNRLELPAATRHHLLFAWETGTYFIPSDSIHFLLIPLLLP